MSQATLGALHRALTADPPIDPTGDQARDALRRELAKPEYYDRDLLQRILDWIGRRLDGTIDSTRDTPSLTWLAATLVAVLLVAGIAWIVSRARLTARAERDQTAVLTDEQVTAAELRARADRALAEGRTEDAVLDGFRALAVRQVERGRLEDRPGSTAHEVAGALAGEYPQQRPRVDASADLFDAVMYGERPARHDQAVAVLTLDDDLGSAR